MSFSKAKRFVYKTPDVECSPADYLLSLDFQKGCSISKCPRFRKPKNSDEEPSFCSRMAHSCCSTYDNTENKYCTKHCKNVDNGTSAEFNRNDVMRKSIKARRKKDQVQTMPPNTKNITTKQRQNNTMDTSLQEIEEFIDDDYRSMTNSTELDDLKNVEEYEFNEVYNALRRIQRKRSAILRKDETFDFQNIVLKKLDAIDKNVKIIKEDIAHLPPKTLFKQLQSPENTTFRTHCQFNPLKKNQEVVKEIIITTIQKLAKNFENKRKSLQKDSQEHILSIIAEMYATNKKSSKQVKELCNVTAEELIQNVNKVLETSTHECASGGEIESTWKELNNSFADKTLQNTTVQDLVVDYFGQTQEISQELEEDFSDITVKCMGTQQMLDVQGVLLNKLKDEIECLKSDLF